MIKSQSTAALLRYVITHFAWSFTFDDKSWDTWWRMLTATLTATHEHAQPWSQPSKDSDGWCEATRPPLRPQGRYRVADATALRAALDPGDLYGPCRQHHRAGT